jgi:hypothetical protein
MRCGHCGNSAPMQIVAVYSQVTDYEAPGTPVHWQAGNIYELVLCPACKQVSLRSTYYHDAYDPEDMDYTLLYPSSETAPEGLPQSIAKAYEAARRVRNIDANAFAVLLGRVLELVCEDRQATGRDLYAKLQDLAAKREIPEKLVDVGHGLRNLRNVGAHAVLGELTSAEAPILDALTRAILEYVYSAPLLAQMAERRLDQLRQARST